MGPFQDEFPFNWRYFCHFRDQLEEGWIHPLQPEKKSVGIHFTHPKKLAPVTVAKADTGLAASEAFPAAGLSAAKGVKGVGLAASAAGLAAAKGFKGVGPVASEAFPAAGLSVSEGSKATKAPSLWP